LPIGGRKVGQAGGAGRQDQVPAFPRGVGRLSLHPARAQHGREALTIRLGRMLGRGQPRRRQHDRASGRVAEGHGLVVREFERSRRGGHRHRPLALPDADVAHRQAKRQPDDGEARRHRSDRRIAGRVVGAEQPPGGERRQVAERHRCPPDSAWTPA
jgi:hypothetical protein